MNTDILKNFWSDIKDRFQGANDDENTNPYVSGFKRDFTAMLCIYLLGWVCWSIIKMDFLVFEGLAIWNFPEWVRGILCFTNLLLPMFTSGYRVRKELYGDSEGSTSEEE